MVELNVSCTCPARLCVDREDYLVSAIRNGEPVYQIWSFDGNDLKQIVSTDDVRVSLARA